MGSSKFFLEISNVRRLLSRLFSLIVISLTAVIVPRNNLYYIDYMSSVTIVVEPIYF